MNVDSVELIYNFNPKIITKQKNFGKMNFVGEHSDSLKFDITYDDSLY